MSLILKILMPIVIFVIVAAVIITISKRKKTLDNLRNEKIKFIKSKIQNRIIEFQEENSLLNQGAEITVFDSSSPHLPSGSYYFLKQENYLIFYSKINTTNMYDSLSVNQNNIDEFHANIETILSNLFSDVILTKIPINKIRTYKMEESKTLLSVINGAEHIYDIMADSNLYQELFRTLPEKNFNFQEEKRKQELAQKNAELINENILAFHGRMKGLEENLIERKVPADNIIWYDKERVDNGQFLYEDNYGDFNDYKLTKIIYFKLQGEYYPFEANFGAEFFTLDFPGSKQLGISESYNNIEFISPDHMRKIDIDNNSYHANDLSTMSLASNESRGIKEVESKLILLRGLWDYYSSPRLQHIFYCSLKDSQDIFLHNKKILTKAKGPFVERGPTKFSTYILEKMKTFKFKEDHKKMISSFCGILDKRVFDNTLFHDDWFLFFHKRDDNYIKYFLKNNTYDPKLIKPRKSDNLPRYAQENQNLKDYFVLWELLKDEYDDGYDGFMMELMLLEEIRKSAGEDYFSREFKHCLQSPFIPGKDIMDESLFREFVLNCLYSDLLTPPWRFDLVLAYLEVPKNNEFNKEEIINELSQQISKEKMFNKLSSSTKVSRKYSINDVDVMDGFEFEEFVGLLFREMGYMVDNTKKTGDQGDNVQ